MRSPLGMINTSGAQPSLGLDTFKMYQSGQMNRREYLVANALETAKNAYRWYIPKAYPQMNSVVVGYVDGRISGARSYDQAIAKKLGDWVKTTIQTHDSNTGDLDHLAWCMGQLEALKVGDAISKLERAMGEYQTHQCPYAILERAIRVKSIDAMERSRSA